MPRIRTIKPDFFFDEDLCTLPHKNRLFFIGLWTQADRDGRGEDRPDRLKANIYPYEKVDGEAIMQTLAPHFIIRYEKEGRRYFQIRNFSKHQRPHHREPASEYPEPTEGRDGLSPGKAVPGPVPTQGRDGVGPLGREGKGKEGKGTPMADPAFEAFWGAYPRKVAKSKAAEAWRRASPTSAMISTIAKALESHKASQQWADQDGRYIPHPTTWLNQRRWEDVLDTPAPAKTKRICAKCRKHPPLDGAALCIDCSLGHL